MSSASKSSRAEDAKPGAGRARISAITSGKGGVGKTFMSANLAAALARRGERVLVLDADLGMANLDVVLNLFPKVTLHDVFTGKCSLEEALLPAPGGFDVLLAGSGLVEYSRELNAQMTTLFPAQSMADILGAAVAAAGLAQLRMAETEKYPHVTWFLNGGEETPYPGETRIMVPSPQVATYDLQPRMSAPALTAKAVAAIREGRQDLIVLNFANADMVGHTGSLPAAIAACEAVDAGLGAIADAVRAAGGALLVTADHGNAEQMRDPLTGQPHTAHTTNRVPVFLMGGPPGAALHDGRLADVAPTLLALLGVAQPDAMTGRSLLA